VALTWSLVILVHGSRMVEIQVEPGAGASDEMDRLKSQMKSWQFHLPDAANSTMQGYFKYHDIVCTNLQFDQIHSDNVRDSDLMMGLTIDCKGQFSATMSSFLVGSGNWEAKLTNRAGTAELGAEPTEKGKCQVDFHSVRQGLQGGSGFTAKTAAIMRLALAPFVNSFVKYQLQSKVCAAFEDLIQEATPSKLPETPPEPIPPEEIEDAIEEEPLPWEEVTKEEETQEKEKAEAEDDVPPPEPEVECGGPKVHWKTCGTRTGCKYVKKADASECGVGFEAWGCYDETKISC